MNKDWEITQCLKCGFRDGFEIFSSNEAACKYCRTHYKLTPITDEEMIEWFID